MFTEINVHRVMTQEHLFVRPTTCECGVVNKYVYYNTRDKPTCLQQCHNSERTRSRRNNIKYEVIKQTFNQFASIPLHLRKIFAQAVYLL